MRHGVYFHRNIKAGFSINKVTQSVVRNIKGKEEFFVPCVRALPWSLIKNILFVFRHRRKDSINHITGDIHYCMIALKGCKSVLTIHDTCSVDYYNKGSRLKRAIDRLLWFTIPLRIATRVVCISENTKRSVERLCGRKDIKVIYNAIDPAFVTVPKDVSQRPYRILHIGTTPNKNLERTIQSLKGIECELVIVGRLTPDQRTILDESGIKYQNKFDLSDSEIIKEYIDCDVVSFISLFEGFGMPIIEANKTGRPVITSSIPVLKEIGSDSVLYVNPEDVNDMHAGFMKMIEDPSLRKECVEKGLKNVMRFEPEMIIESWKSLYNSI